jgi:hypothetical protein
MLVKLIIRYQLKNSKDPYHTVWSGNKFTDLRSVWLPRQFSQPLPEHLLRLDIKVLVPEEHNTAL